MWARTVLVVAALGGTAAAEALDVSLPYVPEPAPETHRLGIGQPGDKVALDRVGVAIRQDPLGTSASVTLSVSTAEVVPHEAVIALAVPRGARVTDVAITIGKTERMVAHASTAATASAEYQRWFDRGKDPVLVQWKDERPEGDVLEIRAFPLTKTDRGRIELTIELPQDMAALTVDAIAPTVEVAGDRTYRKVRRPIVVQVPVRRELELPLAVARPSVSKETSLYAGFAPSMAVPPRVVINIGRRPSWVVPAVSSSEIRKEVKRHRARLQHCYERVVQYRGGIEGEAVLHFLVGRTGKIEAVNVDGTITDEQITSCLKEVVASFEFRAGDGTVQVNYPLRFQLASY